MPVGRVHHHASRADHDPAHHQRTDRADEIAQTPRRQVAIRRRGEKLSDDAAGQHQKRFLLPSQPQIAGDPGKRFGRDGEQQHRPRRDQRGTAEENSRPPGPRQQHPQRPEHENQHRDVSGESAGHQQNVGKSRPQHPDPVLRDRRDPAVERIPIPGRIGDQRQHGQHHDDTEKNIPQPQAVRLPAGTGFFGFPDQNDSP